MKTYGWELLAVYNHPDKSGDHKYCDSGDIIFLIFQVTSREHMFKGLLNYGWNSLMMSHHLAMLSSHWSSASGD